ncbi:MAG: helix-turn-helix transcriptional regulator [Treponema sp.]|nr:helix-turn-helix transcriptional regulator [Treponema sp.]
MERQRLTNSEQIEMINKMHEYLQIFRKLANYSSEELGEEIGVSRSTMINFERNVPNIRMSKAQYIALKTVLEYRANELKEKGGDDSLEKAIELVFYNADYDNNKSSIKQTLVTAGAICGVSGGMAVSTLLGTVLGGVVPFVGVGITIGTVAGILNGIRVKQHDK